MENMTRDTIMATAKKLVANYETQNISDTSLKSNLPDREEIYALLDDLMKITFPGYFATEQFLSREAFAEGMIVTVFERLNKQIRIALSDQGTKEKIKVRAEKLTVQFLEEISNAQALLMKDVEAA